jgi:hypothetical protein
MFHTSLTSRAFPKWGFLTLHLRFCELFNVLFFATFVGGSKVGYLNTQNLQNLSSSHGIFIERRFKHFIFSDVVSPILKQNPIQIPCYFEVTKRTSQLTPIKHKNEHLLRRKAEGYSHKTQQNDLKYRYNAARIGRKLRY